MTVPTKPRTHVLNPSFTPLPYGLLTTLTDAMRETTDLHWQIGVNYDSVCANGGTTYDDCYAVSGTGVAPVGLPPTKAATTAITHRGATPFTVYAEVDCSAPDFWYRANEVVGDALTQSEQWQVERAIWTGLAGGQLVVFPHLSANAEIIDSNGITLQTSTTTVSGGALGPFDVVEALGVIESELANCYDGVGVIHVPRVLLPAFASEGLIKKDGSIYRTVGGNIIVFGAGYTGSSPSGVVPPSSVWIYATGAMFVYRSDAQVLPIQPERGSSGSFDRMNNTIRAIAERTYVIGWDCCQIGVNVSTGGIITGAVSTSG